MQRRRPRRSTSDPYLKQQTERHKKTMELYDMAMDIMQKYAKMAEPTEVYCIKCKPPTLCAKCGEPAYAWLPATPVVDAEFEEKDNAKQKSEH